ncbi:hypothetical protein N5J06_18735 [Ralstonia sp. CHL-2022]|uniref:DUF4132 domain-containing protein n=1 Tax=Ralstonia mojiangensis TaxID=2953895 RepID=A0ABT2LEG5_9RALS|nr:hypothetical protein [Ralstonia mojiangensis]MCT7313014.1 hypothetical protein [Ralstonia mojiangensis]
MTMPANATTFPIRASYGERDKTHALLTCSADEAIMPALLLELTDKPPGYVPSGERWWPSVGCGPVGQWWALWWTVPDHNATRGGMVRSEVSLWPLDEVPSIRDLAVEMQALNGGEPLHLVSREVLATVAESLISGNAVTPVFGDLDLWPSLVASLWQRLGPDARMSFAARVAISPPLGGESVSPPWLYAVSEDRINQWPNTAIVPIASAGTGIASRGARWVSGEVDAIIDELIAANVAIGPSLSGVRRISRAADRLESLRQSADARGAIELLRTLCAIAPDRGALVEFKSEGLAALQTTLPTAPIDLVSSVANIRLSELPEQADTLLPSIVESWAAEQLPKTDTADASHFFSLVLTGKAEQWWITSTRAGIKRGIRDGAAIWPSFLLRWLSSSAVESIVEVLGVRSLVLEGKVLATALATAMSQMEYKALLKNARTLQWSRVHALAALSVLPPKEALASQLAFGPDSAFGLEILVDKIPGSVLVENAIETGDKQLLSLVAQRTSMTPDLLAGMDLSKKAWRTLWEFHIEAGGVLWPPNVDRDIQAGEFLASLASEGQGASIVARFARDFAPAALKFPDRSALWSDLERSAAEALATEVARLIVDTANSGLECACPEPGLLPTVHHVAVNGNLGAHGAARLLIWQPQISESGAEDVIACVRYWGETGATALGQVVLDRGWRRIARWLTTQYQRGFTAVLPAIHACSELYTIWELWFVPMAPGASSKPIEHNQLITRVAELGSTLAASRLDELWQRAGGKSGALLHSGTEQERWHDAARKAATGALQDRIMSLVDVLLEDLPHNTDLEALKKIIRDCE